MTNEERSVKLDELHKKYQAMAEAIELDSKYEPMEMFYKRLFVDYFWWKGDDVGHKVLQCITDAKPKQVIDVSKLSRDPMYYNRNEIYIENIDKYYEQCYREEIQKHLQCIIDEDKRNELYDKYRLYKETYVRPDFDLINEMIEEYFNRFCELIKQYVIEDLKIWDYKVVSFEQEFKELEERVYKWADEWNSMTPFERMMNNFLNRETAPTLKEGYVVLFFCLAIEFIFNHFYSWWIITIIIFLCWRKKEIDKYHGRGNKKDLWKW